MRVSFARVIFAVFFLGIILRLFYWQTVKADELQSLAEKQRSTSQKIEPKRGDILFSDGSVLASSKPTFLLYALPKTLTDESKLKLSKLLSGILIKDDKEKAKELELDLKNKLLLNLYSVDLQKNISIENKKEIESLKPSGIGFKDSSSRFYPEGSSSAHLLGFVGSDSRGEATGYFGLEGEYNGELKGFSGLLKLEKDSAGAPILIGNFLGTTPRNGKNLILNVDRTVQFIVEDNLKKGMEKYSAKSASAAVMDPKTGGILALASFPSYDPGSFDQFPKETHKNPFVADSYEPGSTFKILVMSGAINEEAVKSDTECDICEGPVEVGGFEIRTWDNKYFPRLTMKDTIIHSDNTGMVFTGRKLGLDKLYSYIQNYGFGEKTNIDLQDEASPDLRSKDNWREIDLATTSFGQGIAVTPIQMLTAVSAIANGGKLMEPHVVKEVRDDSSVFEIKPKVVRQVISENAAKIITDMMVAAVNEGEAKFAKPKGFNIAGKTGTAQIPVAGHYDPNKTIASFVGFAPPEDPKFVILVRYDQPTSSIFGAETAAPTFFEIAKQLFNYYKIAPSE